MSEEHVSDGVEAEEGVNIEVGEEHVDVETVKDGQQL